MKEYQLHGLRALAQSPKGTVPAFLQAPATQGAWRFHHALEDYGPTPLVRLNGLAEELGLGGVFVKDESLRFGLNAFKGLGGIYALSRAVARELGLPEGRLPLAEAAVLLATAPKSNSAYNAINAAMRDIRKGKVGQVPRHLQNVHADSTGSGKAPAYKYPHDYPHHYVAQRYLPEALGDVTYYEYGDNKTEQAARRYWEDIKKN